jgi:hypothetical protein
VKYSVFILSLLQMYTACSGICYAQIRLYKFVNTDPIFHAVSETGCTFQRHSPSCYA